MKEFYCDDITGDLVGDEIHDRNEAIQEDLGITLVYKETPGNDKHMTDFIKIATTDIESGSSEYQIIAGYSRTAPAMTLNGQVRDLNELNYINFSKPWWPQALVDECMINNKLFFCSGDISTNLLWMMTATFFNKELISKFDLENPYTLVSGRKWTIDKMIEMLSNTYNDVDGLGKKDPGDFFGYSIYNINIDGFFNGINFRAIERNASGQIIESPTLSDQKIYDLLDKLGDFLNSDDAYYVNSTSERDIFFSQRSIMTSDRVFIVAGKDNGDSGKIEFEYGIIPQPMYDTNQGNYVTNIGHPYTMYAISNGVKNDDIANMCAAVIERFASESYKRITPKVFEEAMKVKYASDKEASDMYDILRGTVTFDLGRLYSSNIGDVYQIMRQQVTSNAGSFASHYKTVSRNITNGLKKISDAYN